MKFVKVHKNFQLPVRASTAAGGLDIIMPEAGSVNAESKALIPLGFKAAVPQGYVAFILPRSSAGYKKGIRLNNTVGLIDSDYRGEWMAAAGQHTCFPEAKWEAGDRVFQIVVVPVADVNPELVEELDETSRGEGSFGSTGQ